MTPVDCGTAARFAALTNALPSHLRRAPQKRAYLVAITGIDAAGKGLVTAGVAAMLRAEGLNVAEINIDGWLNLPHKRFAATRPAQHFYENAIRFEALFRDLVFPLRQRRSLRLRMDFAEETATAYRPHVYEYADIDVILLEGIFLLKREFQRYYDLSVWVECSFRTALRRAIAREQEGLTPEATTRAYQQIYFPAQEIHRCRDQPRSAASMIFVNDPLADSPVYGNGITTGVPSS